MNLQQEQYPQYESIEFSLPTGNTDYDLDTNQSTFLSVFGLETTGNNSHNGRYPTSVEIRTSATISVKLNSTSNHSITISSTDSPFSIVGVQIKDLYITNSSGNSAAIKLLFTDNPN